MIGATCVNLNPLYSENELTEIINDCAPKIIFCWIDMVYKLKLVDHLVKNVITVMPGDFLGLKGSLINFFYRIHRMKRKNDVKFQHVRLTDCMKKANRLTPVQLVEVDLSDLALLLYTSGTTGECKGVPLTHCNLIAATRAAYTAILDGGMALNDKVRKDWKLVTNTEIFEGYGMSETTGLISCQRPILHEDNDKFSLSIEEQQISSVGKIIPNCSVKIIPIQDKIEYTNNENAPISSKEIGEICGRIKNIVIISGFNVYPAEIEKVVRNCPKVNDCVVIGKTDKNNIEYLYMLVEKDIDANLTEQEVKQYCADNLAPYKRPKVIEITVSLPRTPIGKVSLSDL
uniref:Medium-chain acyl-CoA ligase ACSF2, mitochondrial n=1 Tax=Dermatophagoides pteronyssinus TaxID=6956 RepID=A0A6P6YDI5_DERPT|nr:uncharacterized protein LOC113796662 [Dermatophagoides pteronyssinus]